MESQEPQKTQHAAGTASNCLKGHTCCSRPQQCLPFQLQPVAECRLMALWKPPAQSALVLIRIFAGGNSPSVQAAPHSQQEGSLTLADAQHALEPASLSTAQPESGGMGLKKVHTASADADGDEVGSLAAQVCLLCLRSAASRYGTCCQSNTQPCSCLQSTAMSSHLMRLRFMPARTRDLVVKQPSLVRLMTSSTVTTCP